MEEYLKPTEFIDSDSEVIKSKAREIVQGLSTDMDRAVALFYFARDAVRFDPLALGLRVEHHKASTILQRGTGYCQHKAILLVALARASGIPARLGFIDIRDHRLPRRIRKFIGGDNEVFFHGYAELHLDGRWVHASPTFDLQTCRQNGFVTVEFNGINDARDPSHDLQGNPHIEFLRDRGSYADFPWDEIWDSRLVLASRAGQDLNEMMARWWKAVLRKDESGSETLKEGDE